MGERKHNHYFVYERRAASLDWYEGDKHIQPWSKLSPEEQEQWRKPLRKY